MADTTDEERRAIRLMADALAVLVTDPEIKARIDPNAYMQARRALALVGYTVPPLTEYERRLWIERNGERPSRWPGTEGTQAEQAEEVPAVTTATATTAVPWAGPEAVDEDPAVEALLREYEAMMWSLKRGGRVNSADFSRVVAELGKRGLLA